MFSDLMTYCVPLINHPLGFYILMITISVLQVWGDTGTKALGQITGQLCLRLASAASATWPRED